MAQAKDATMCTAIHANRGRN